MPKVDDKNDFDDKDWFIAFHWGVGIHLPYLRLLNITVGQKKVPFIFGFVTVSIVLIIALHHFIY